MNRWILAARLRTLPLAIACIFLGNAVSFYENKFSFVIFILSILTALFLQILANFANDLGDAIKGTDNETRVGPIRAVSSGLITQKTMNKGIFFNILLCCISGFSLVFYSFCNDWVPFLIFLILGFSSIIAAIMYTVGKYAYGYHGLGDLFSFIFFGLIGVVGSYYLQVKLFSLGVFILAVAHGLLVVAVLNVNNMRDYKDDKIKGKNTIVVKFGLTFARFYHSFLCFLSFCLYLAYVIMFGNYLSLLFLIGFIVIFKSWYYSAWIGADKIDIDPELKRTSVGSFFVSLLFSFGLVLS